MDEAVLRKAIQLNKSGKKAEARALFAEIVSEEPENLTAWFWLVDSIESIRDRVSTLRQAQLHHPDDPQLIRALSKFEADLASEERFFNEIETLKEEIEEPLGTSREALPVVPQIFPVDIINQYVLDTDESSASSQLAFNNEREQKKVSTTASPRPIVQKADTTQKKAHKNKGESPKTPAPKKLKGVEKTKDKQEQSNSHSFWFFIVLVFSALMLFLFGTIWQVFFLPGNPSSTDNSILPTLTMELTETLMEEEISTQTPTNEPGLTITPEATFEPTQTQSSNGSTATPIIAATITPTPAVPEGLFLPLEGTSFNDFAWSPDGSYFAVATSRGINVFDGRSFASRNVISADPILPIRAFTISEDERYIAAGFISQQSSEEYVTRAKLWNIFDAAEINSVNYSQPRGDVDALAFSLDGQTLWTNALYDQVIKWRVSDGALLNVFELSNSIVDYYDIAFAPDRRSFIAYSLYDRLRLFDSETGDLITPLGVEKEITGAVYSPNSQYLAVSYQNLGEIRVWDLPGKQVYRLINTHTDGIIAMAFNPFNRILAAVTSDGLIKFYDIHTGEELRVISRQVDGVNQITFSPDDTMLAVLSATEVQVWELLTDRLLVTFRIGN